MLTIKDLTADCTLDSAALSGVRGGSFIPYAFMGYWNAPTIDAGVHNGAQVQTSVIDQRGNVGGFNAVASGQSQNGISGQVWW